MQMCIRSSRLCCGNDAGTMVVSTLELSCRDSSGSGSTRSTAAQSTLPQHSRGYQSCAAVPNTISANEYFGHRCTSATITHVDVVDVGHRYHGVMSPVVHLWRKTSIAGKRSRRPSTQWTRDSDFSRPGIILRVLFSRRLIEKKRGTFLQAYW
jgi:hypothetical protein